MQCRNHRRAPELDRLEGAVPHARMQHAFERIAFPRHLGQVESGRKMRAFAGQHHGANVLRQPGEEGLQTEHGHIVEGVALLRAGEAQMGDGAMPGGFQRRGQIN